MFLVSMSSWLLYNSNKCKECPMDVAVQRPAVDIANNEVAREPMASMQMTTMSQHQQMCH
jgi:hypothetical protein